jgi:hypothetical protein
MQPRFGLSFYNQLKRELGEIDASAACLELAMREFISASRQSSSPTTFIQKLSGKHGVRVDVFDIGLFVRRGSALRIIGVTQAFEGFLEKFLESHPRIQNRKGRQDDETLLNFVVRKLGLSSVVAAAFTDAFDYRLYTYYRQLRNGIAHQTQQPQTSAAVPSLQALQKDTANDARYIRLSAPNTADHLTFDDYVLFSRAAKAIAARLCEISGLSEPEIMEWLEMHRDRSGSIKRQANNVRTLLRVAFGLDPGSAEKFVINLNLVGQ